MASGLEARAVFLTPRGREIPRGLLTDGSVVTSDPQSFTIQLERFPDAKGYVNLAGQYPIDPVRALDHLEFYVPTRRVQDLEDRAEELAEFHLELEGDVLWLRRANAFANSVRFTELLLRWREGYEALEQSAGGAPATTNATTTHSQILTARMNTPRLLERVKPIGKAVYPHLPGPVRKQALRVWSALVRRTR